MIMQRAVFKLGKGFVLAFLIVALAAGYWSIVQRESLLAREDNPRRVLAEQAIQRGLILDRQGRVLTETTSGPDESSTRHYPHPAAAPATGYYSLRYGVGGIEAVYNDHLSGLTQRSDVDRLRQSLLHTPQVGGDVQLTIDITIQEALAAALGERPGAVVLLDAASGDILALVSAPIYDPNTLDDQWESLSTDPAAPLLNRATQGLYQPGTALQSVLLSTAFDMDLVEAEDSISGPLEVTVSGVELPCTTAGQSVTTLADAYYYACPAPFQQVARAVGAHWFDTFLRDFGLLAPPPLVLPTEAVALAEPPAAENLALTAIGQSALTVTPLHMARVAATPANQGQMPPLRLVLATRPSNGRAWTPQEASGHPQSAVGRSAAAELATLMIAHEKSATADSPIIMGEHAGLAISGPGDTFNSWYLGFAHDAEGHSVAVAVLLENTRDVEQAAQLGQDALRAGITSLQP